jgi:hypothetical protein
MRKLAVALMASLAAGAGALAAAAPAQAADTATVYVVHGVPDTPVNVFVDGASALSNFTPGTVAGPLELPAGSHEVKVFPASDTQGTGAPVLSATADLQAGQNVSLVAHLNADGAPAITPFANDVSAVAAGEARLVVRHTAAAPAVDVRANGAVAFANLTNPNQVAADLPAGTISADVVLAGTTTVALGPADVTLNEGTSTIVYAIGSASASNLSLVVQTIGGLHSAPGSVPAGSAGLADEDGAPVALLMLAAAGIGLAGAGAVRMRRSAAGVR